VDGCPACDVDTFIAEMGWGLPGEHRDDDEAILEAPATPMLQLEPDQAGITSIIWATGY